MSKKPCPPDVLNKILEARRAELEAQGFTPDRIKADLAHLSEMIRKPREYAALAEKKLDIPAGLTTKEQAELNSLQSKLMDGLNSGNTTIESVLGEQDARRFKLLLYKKFSGNREASLESQRSASNIMDVLQEKEKQLVESGDNLSARRVRLARRRIERISRMNTRMGRNYIQINKLDLQLKEVEESILAYKILSEKTEKAKEQTERQNKKIKDLSTRIAELGNRLEAINTKIETASKTEANKLKKTAASLKRDIDKKKRERDRFVQELAQEKSRLRSLQRNTPLGRVITELENQQRSLVSELSKFGVNRAVALNNIIDNVPATGRLLAMQMEEASQDIKFKSETISLLFEESETVEAVVIGKLFGDNFVMQRVEKNKPLTRKEVEELFDEYKEIKFEYAGARERFIMDMEFSDKQSLEEIAQTTIDAETEGATIEEAESDYPIVPTIPAAEASMLSNPGIIPPQNLLSDNEGEILYGKLKSLLYRLETLRRLPNFGKFVDLAFVQKIMSDIDKIDDVDAAILFKSALSWDRSNTRAAHMSHQELMEITKNLLRDLGIDEDILASEEFTNPINWVKNAPIVSLDIETHLDAEGGIHTIILMDENGTENYESVRSAADGNNFTPEELMQVLQTIEDLQNSGMLLATFNGNGFDLLAIADKISTTEARQMAARIMLRSVDIFQNLRSFGSTSNTSPTLKVRRFSLSNTADALNIAEDKLGQSFMPSLWKKRSLGRTVTMADLERVSDGKLNQTEKEMVVEQVNAMDAGDARSILLDYSMADGRLNIKVLSELRQREDSSVRIRHSDGNIYNTTIQEMLPTWGLSSRHSSIFGGVEDAISGWSRFEEGQQINASQQSLLLKDNVDAARIDLDKAQPIIMTLMALSLEHSPKTKAFGKAMLNLAKRGVTAEEQAYLTAINIANENSKASSKLNKAAYINAGRRLPLGIRGVNETGGSVPGLNLAEGNAEAQKSQYINAIVGGATAQIKALANNRTDRFNEYLAEIAETVEYQPQDTNISQEDYIFGLVVHAIKRYSRHKEFNIEDFGNGNIDFAVGDSLGRGVIQAIMQTPQGFQRSLHAEAVMKRDTDLMKAEKIAAASTEGERLNLPQIFRLPLIHEVNHIFPRSLAEIETAYNDFRLRKRISHILNTPINSLEEAKSIIDSYMNQKEVPEEVIAEVSDILLQLAPNTNNRNMGNKLPTMEEYIYRATEALLDLPELLMMWQHDSVTYAPGSKVFLSEEARNRYFAEDALSPGSLSGASLLSGMGPLFAHVKTYPILTEALLFKSLENGIEQYKKGHKSGNPYSLSNYFDFNMNGVHHIAALTLMYMDEDGSALDSMLNEIKYVDKPEDRYQKSVDLLRENLDRIKARYISEGDTYNAEQADRLKEFLDKDSNSAREAFKTAVIARLYMGGLPAVFKGIRNWSIENNNDLNGVDPRFIAEHLMNTKNFIQMHILDSALGNVTASDRRRLSELIATKLQGVYNSPDWHEKLRKIARKNGFDYASRSMFSLNQVEEAMMERIKFIAAMVGKPVEEIAKIYEGRIEAAQKYMESIGGQISHDSQMKRLNEILVGNADAYKTSAVLTAINALQRTPYRLSGTETGGIAGRVEEHSGILGRHLEESDLLGYENFNIYFLLGLDTSGGRLYMHGHKFQPQNSKLSSVIRKGTPEGDKDNPYAMWEFGRNNLAELGKEKAEAEVLKIVARHISLQLAKSYAPKFGDYSMENFEGRELFMNEWSKRSELENQKWQRERNREYTLDESIKDLRRSNGGMLADSERFLLDPSRNIGEAMQSEYIPGSNLKGLLAFQTKYAPLPWEERGIFSLQEMAYNRNLESTRNLRAQRPNREIASVNDVIPRESRGYKNRYKGSKAPYVYETPFDSTYEMTTTSTSRRLELQADMYSHVLEKFARSHGYMDLLEQGEWAKLFTIWKVTNAVLNPFLSNMEKLKHTGSNATAHREFRQAQEHALNMYQSLTNLWSFHDDVSNESRSYLEFGKMVGIEGKKVRGMYYMDFLLYLAKIGVNALNPITLGLSVTNNILAVGTPAADQRTTRFLTLTVQSIDSLQVIFNVLYESVGRQVATDYMKRVDPANFDSLEKDGTGHVLLSSVPIEHQRSILTEILQSEKVKDDPQFDLYLFLDDYGKMQIGNRVDVENINNLRIDTSQGKAPKIRSGGFIRFDTSITEANTVYHLTPEDINNMFTALQNQVLFHNAELASALGSDIGVATNENMKFLNAERRKFYEMQRLEYADQMDILAILHNRAGTKMQTTNNIRMRGDFGMPLEVYNARYYVAGEDGRGSALSLAWKAKINQAIMNANIYGLETERAAMEILANFSDGNLIPAVIIISQVEGQDIIQSKKRLEAYFGNVLTKPEINRLYSLATGLVDDTNKRRPSMNYVQAFLSATNRTEIRNPYFHAAKRYVELHGPINDVPNVLDSVLRDIGVTDLTNTEERTKAKKALTRANTQYSPDFRLMDEDILTLAETDGLTDAFGIKGNHIETTIKELVDQKVISEETAEMYRGMLGIILTHNEEYATNLSIILDHRLDRVGLSQQLGDRFVITLNPTLLKKRATPEALEVFAHELSHIARLQYLENQSAEYQGFIAAFRTTAGKDAIRDMVGAMFSGDTAEMNELMRHYATNPEEFLAEWGAFILISRTVNNKTVINNINKLRESHAIADESASWWERAFHRIKTIASSILQRMQVFKNKNPEAMKLMEDVVEVMFNFGNTYSKSRVAADIKSRSFTYPLTELTKGSSLLDAPGIKSLHQKVQKMSELQRKGTLTKEETDLLATLTTETREFSSSGERSTTILGQNTLEYVRHMDRMLQIEGGELKVAHRPENEEEKTALATFILEKVVKMRGRRGGELIKSVAKSLEDMPSKSQKLKRFLTDVLYNGTSRKVGETGMLGMAGHGGGNSSNLTYASAEPILAALGFILDTTKGTGENVYRSPGGGIIRNLNYITQWAQPVIRQANKIRDQYSKKKAIDIERTAFDWLLFGKPNDKDSLPRGKSLSPDEFKKAKEYAEVYVEAMNNFVDLAREFGSYTQSLEPPKDLLAIRLQNRYLEKSRPETVLRFTEALKAAFRKKILDNLKPNGIADPYSLYLSGGMFEISSEMETQSNSNDPINQFYKDIQSGRITLTEGQRLIFKDIEEHAAKLYEEKHPANPLARQTFFSRLEADPLSNAWNIEVRDYLKKAALALLRRAAAGQTYSKIFVSLTSDEVNTVLTELRNRVDTDSINNLYLAEGIEKGNLPSIFPHSANLPKFMRSQPNRLGNSPAAVRARKMLMAQGHATTIPDIHSLELTAHDIHVQDNGLSVEDAKILREGFSVNLQGLATGVQKYMARSAYNNKAIKEITGVDNISFSWLVSVIQNQKNDSDWDTVLKEVKRKHDLAIGAATVMEDSEGSGSEHIATKIADVATGVLWGQNRNIAALTSEASISVFTSLMFRGNTTAMLMDLLGSSLALGVRVFSRNLGNRFLQQPLFTTVPEAMNELNSATYGLLEHHIMDPDAISPEEKDRLRQASGSRVAAIGSGFIGGWWRRLKDSHLVVEPALRVALGRQAQRQLLSRISKLKEYLDFIENHKGPINQQMYEDAAREIGTQGFMPDFANTEKVLIQMMMESGILTEKTIKALKYIIKKYGTSKAGITRREFLNIGAIQLQMAMEGNPSLFDEISGSDGLTKNDIYEALAAVNRFGEAYSKQSVVKGTTLDRPTNGDPKSFLMNLYRSFPKLFAAQYVLETYGRTSPVLLVGRLLVASVTDLIYNFLLMFAVGMITERDLERISKGDMNADDVTKILSAAMRNPMLSGRMSSAILGQLALVAGNSLATGRNPFTNTEIMRSVLPPSVAAAVSGVSRMGSLVHSTATSSEGEGPSPAMTIDMVSRLVPLIDPITRYVMMRAADPDYLTNRGRQGKSGKHLSPYTASHDAMNINHADEYEVLRDVLKELFPTGYANFIKSFPQITQDADLFQQQPQAAPQQPQAPSQPQTPPMAPQGNTAAPTPSQTPSPPTPGSRATQPAPAPPF